MSKAFRYGQCVTMGSHSFTCHPHTKHIGLYSPAARCSSCLPTKGWPGWVDLTTITVPRTHNRFAVAGPGVWNSLPIGMQRISSYRQFWRYLKNIYLGFEKSQRSVTHDSLQYINILTYLLTMWPRSLAE